MKIITKKKRGDNCHLIIVLSYSPSLEHLFYGHVHRFLYSFFLRSFSFSPSSFFLFLFTPQWRNRLLPFAPPSFCSVLVGRDGAYSALSSATLKAIRGFHHDRVELYPDASLVCLSCCVWRGGRAALLPIKMKDLGSHAQGSCLFCDSWMEREEEWGMGRSE